MFKEGDKVKVKSKSINPEYWKEAIEEMGGKIGYVCFVCDAYIGVGKEINGIFREFSYKDLTLISSDEPNKQRTIKMKLNQMMKKLLDNDTKKLIKADFVDSNLELSEEAKLILQTIIFEEKKAELVRLAEEKIAEDKAE